MIKDARVAHPELTVVRLCDAFSVSRTCFYQHLPNDHTANWLVRSKRLSKNLSGTGIAGSPVNWQGAGTRSTTSVFCE